LTDTIVPPVLAEARAFLKTAVETDAAAIGSAPLNADQEAKGNGDVAATRGVIRALRTDLL